MVKYSICGDVDAPDWLLAAADTVAKVSAVRVKLVAVQVVSDVLGHGIDFDAIMRLTQSQGLDVSAMKRLVAALDFAIKGAGKFNVDSAMLITELYQLGFPRESAELVGRVYRAHQSQIRKKLEDDTLQLPRLKRMEWRVDCVLASASLSDVTAPSVQLKLETSHTLSSSHTAASRSNNSNSSNNSSNSSSNNTTGSVTTMEMSVDKFRVLHNELKAARQLMEAAIALE